MKQITAQVAERPYIDHASFEQTHHRETSGVVASSNDNWRTRANNKPRVIKRTTNLESKHV